MRVSEAKEQGKGEVVCVGEGEVRCSVGERRERDVIGWPEHMRE